MRLFGGVLSTAYFAVCPGGAGREHSEHSPTREIPHGVRKPAANGGRGFHRRGTGEAPYIFGGIRRQNRGAEGVRTGKLKLIEVFILKLKFYSY